LHSIHVRSAAGAGDVGSESLGDLDGGFTDGTSAAVDEDLLVS